MIWERKRGSQTSWNKAAGVKQQSSGLGQSQIIEDVREYIGKVRPHRALRERAWSLHFIL